MAEDVTQRRLAAIVAIDVAGYSRLMGADEVGTLAALKGHRAATDPISQKHGGRIVGTAGDGVLLEFPSVVAAVECAVEIQAVMAERNAEIPDDKKMLYRIGINLGDVLIDGDDIYGDGINVAARLEALAEPGGICVRRVVRNQVRDKVDLVFEDMGEIEVKNIDRPVRVFRVLAEGQVARAPHRQQPIRRWLASAAAVLLIAIVGGGAWWWQSQPDFEPADPAKMAFKLPEEPSIAVLPFDYLGADEDENGFLADGLSENIITVLSQVPAMLVIARNSTFSLKGKAVDVREVSEQFGVRYVLEGSVQRAGDTLRITAQLVDGIDGKHIWAETYDRPAAAEAIFAVQDEITLAVVRNIYGKTFAGDQTYMFKTDNLKAWAEATKGRAAMLAFTSDGLKQARRHFEIAVELDPNFASAVADIGFSHLMYMRLGYASDPNKSLALAESFITRALEMDPSLPFALSRLAVVRVVQKRGKEAQKLAFQAAEIAPSDFLAIATTAWVLKYTGESKRSLPLFAKAKRLQPVTPWWLIADEYGAYLDAKNFVGARALAPAFLASGFPDYFRPFLLVRAALSHLKTEDRAGAEALVAEALGLKPDLSVVALRASDIAYIDKSIPEPNYVLMRELGIPDEPPPSE